MLDGIEANNIIVGAYTDRPGGVCPMLAAHRNGGRTDLASFARAWDRYTGARGRARPATERELNTLRAMLEASIALEELPELPRRDELPRAGRPTPASATAPASCATARAGPGCARSGASTSTSARSPRSRPPSATGAPPSSSSARACRRRAG